ncbi:MAG: hypothetical protein ACFFG0_10250 [Candidatus Thorarchaeota archaeon]
MKLPKELQKKSIRNKPNLSNYSVLKKKLVSSFRKELKRITQNDGRKVIFKKSGDKSIFSDIIDDEMVKNELGLYNAKTHWDESSIEFYLNEDDNNEYFIHLKDYPENFEFLRPILEYIARHEYGHTFLTENIYDLKPKGEREILNRMGYRNLKTVPKSTQDEVFEEIKGTPYYICVQELG